MKKQLQPFLVILLALSMLAGFIWLGYFTDRVAFVELILIYTFLFLCLGIFYRFFSRKWILVFLLGGIIRIGLLLATPALSDDYARFLWDGELVKMGQNPYLETPNDFLESQAERVDRSMENLFELLNSPDYFSVYPPSNQFIFWLTANIAQGNYWNGIVGLRLILILFEFGLFFLLLATVRALGIPIQKLALYWLNPLVILELTVNLHFEGLVLFFLISSLLLMRKKSMLLSGASWGMAIGVKLLPLMLIPSLISMKKSKKSIGFWFGAGVICLVTFGPLLIDSSWINFSQSLKLYQGKFEFNASIYYLLREIGFWIQGYNTIATLTKILSIVTLSLIIWISWKRKLESIQELSQLWLSIFLIYLLFQPVVHPWYIIPALGLSILNRSSVFILWSFTSIFSYQAYQNLNFTENSWMLIIEYLPLFLLILIERKPQFLNLWKEK